MIHAHEIMRTDFITADIDDTVARLIGEMKKHSRTEAVVLEGRNYRGLASKKWLLSSRIDPSTMKIRNLVSHRSKSKTQFFVPVLRPETEIAEIARLMATADVHALPVMAVEDKKEKITGIVSSLDVISAVSNAYKNVRAEDIASMRPVMIIQDEEIGKAMNLMNKHGIGHIVVIDKAGKLVGIASLTDIITDMHVFPRAKTRLPMAASHQRGKHTGFGTGEKTSLLSLPVHNIITHVPNCSTLSPKDSVAKAIDTMTGQGISSIVLTEKDIPVGILTIKDILEDYSKR